MSRRKPLDHTTMRKAGEPEPKVLPDQRPRKWWELEGSECAESIESTVKALQKAQEPRLRQAAISMRLYGNFSVFGPMGAVYAKAMSGQTAVKDRMTDNVTQSAVDTIHSKVMEGKPRPYFLTSGGDYQQQRKAKKLNQFEEGNFYANKTHQLGGLATRDAMVWGDGFIHVFARGGKIRHERVMGAELWVDEEEAQYGFPRNMHRVKDVDRDELAGYFHDKRDDIYKASKVTDRHAISTISDMVKVVESWHLGAMDSHGDLKGGKHCISLVSNSTMLVEPEDWDHDFFPFARFSWCPRPTGYWSQGLCEQLQGDQIELNKELWHIQRSLHIAGSVKVFIHNGSRIVKETVNNEIGGIINWSGTQKPEYVTPTPIHPLYLENPQRIRERMYQKAGISEMSAGGKKPAGLDSGRALREQQDIETDRFKTTQRALDAFYMDIAALDVAIAMEMDSVDVVRVPTPGAFQNIDLKKDVGTLKNSEFILRCYSASSLPKEPSARLQTVQEYIQAGIYTLRQGRKLLEAPDLEAAEALGNAQENIITKTLEDIAYEDEYAPPEPTDDLKLAKEMVVEFIQYMRLQGLEEEKLNQLRNWNSQVDTLIAKTMTQPAPMDPATQPQAAPEAPPQSDMIPNAPSAAA